MERKKPENHFYLQLEGIRGRASEAGYEGWIPVNSCQFGLGVGIGSPSRAVKSRDDEGEAVAPAGDIVVDETDEEAFYRHVRESDAPSNPSMSSLVVTKFTDASSPLLVHTATLRRPLRRAIIEHVYDRTTVRFTISPVFISGFSAGADAGEYEDEDDECSGLGSESISLNFQHIEMHVVDKVRRPLSLPKNPSFATFDPHQATAGAFSLPLELIVSVFLWLDQQSLSRAAMASKRFAFAASDEQLKVFVAHSAAYDDSTSEIHLDGRLVEPFWPQA